MALSANAWTSFPVYYIVKRANKNIRFNYNYLQNTNSTSFLDLEDMDFYRYILTCIADTDYKDWNVLNCLNYLKDHNHLQFTSDSKQEILSAFTSVFKKISESCTINSRVTKKAKKLYDNVHETFQRREITEFFEKVDREFEEVNKL